MADEVSPTMEEEVKEAPKTEATEQMSEETQLLESLKAASISSPEQLDGTIRNARKTFDMQSERDQLSNQLAAMEKRVAATEKQSVVPDDTDYHPVDLDSAITSGVNRALDARDKVAADRQQQMMGAWNTIAQDEDFKLIEDVWNEKLKDPGFVYGVQSGQINPVQEYHQTLRKFYKGIAAKSLKTIETLQKGVAPTVHVESGDARATHDMPSDEELSAQEKTIKETTERADSGQLLSEDDEMALIEASLLKGL